MFYILNDIIEKKVFTPQILYTLSKITLKTRTWPWNDSRDQYGHAKSITQTHNGQIIVLKQHFKAVVIQNFTNSC